MLETKGKSAGIAILAHSRYVGIYGTVFKVSSSEPKTNFKKLEVVFVKMKHRERNPISSKLSNIAFYNL